MSDRLLTLRLVALRAKTLCIWYNPQRLAHRDLLQSEHAAEVIVREILGSPRRIEPSCVLDHPRAGMAAAGPSASPTSPVRPTPGPLFDVPALAGGRETGSWTPAASPGLSVNRLAQGPATCRAGGLGKTETDVVVPVVGIVPVPVGDTQVLRFVVPGTATEHAPAVSWPIPLLNTAWEKIPRRRPSVSACFAWPIQL